MGSAVLRRRGQRLLQRIAGVSVFGDGLLERARSTSLALLGGIAATGLAIVAFALQLGWPIGADRPLPSAPQKRQAVGAGVAVAATPSRPAHRRGSPGGTTRRAVARRVVTPAVDAAGAQPAPTGNPVVSESEPAPPRHPHPQGHQEAPPGQPAPAPQPPPASQSPSASPSPQAPQEGGSKPEPASQPEPATVSQPEPPPEPEAEASSVPGAGHAYGKGNGSGPPAPPPAVGNPHARSQGTWDEGSGDQESLGGRPGDPHCHHDD
jgi:hypothetical protein